MEDNNKKEHLHNPFPMSCDDLVWKNGIISKVTYAYPAMVIYYFLLCFIDIRTLYEIIT